MLVSELRLETRGDLARQRDPEQEKACPAKPNYLLGEVGDNLQLAKPNGKIPKGCICVFIERVLV